MFLYVKSLGNLLTLKTRNDMTVSAFDVGLLFPYLFSEVILAPSHRDVAYSSTLLITDFKPLW